MKDLLRWKQYCAERVLQTKYGPTRSLPSLSKRGASTVGTSMVVNVVDRAHSGSAVSATPALTWAMKRM